jgi:hypothetical protein
MAMHRIRRRPDQPLRDGTCKGGHNTHVELPPRDPHEPEEVEVGCPTVIFASGQPRRSDERLADVILTARPGVLFVVCAPG